MRGRLVLATTLSVLVLLGPVGSSVGATSRIKAAGAPGSFHWKPSSRTISKGDKVVWKNPTSARHTVTSYGGGWKKDTKLATNGSTSFKFRKSGTYLFRCKLHSTLSNGQCSGMCGSVKVGG